MFASYLAFLLFISFTQSITHVSSQHTPSEEPSNDLSIQSLANDPSIDQSIVQSVNPNACATPMFLFEDSISLFGTRYFPTSSYPVQIPKGSWVERCPIDQSNFQSTNQSIKQTIKYSCCNDSSVQVVEDLVDEYSSQRAKLLDLTNKLTLDTFYGVLINQSSNAQVINQSMSQLTGDQYIAVQSIYQSINESIDLGIQCADHWMGYLSGMFCLGCDPLGALKYTDMMNGQTNNQSNDQSADQQTRQFLKSALRNLYLDKSTCHQVFSHCGPFIQSVFLNFQSMQSNFQAIGSLDQYPRWYKLSWLIDQAFGSIKSSINVDMCFPGNCESWFCDGSWMEDGAAVDQTIDLLINPSISQSNNQSVNQSNNQSNNQSIKQSNAQSWYQHGFRGVNYAWSTASFDRLIDVQSVLSYVICLFRFGYQRDEPFGPSTNPFDGCPRQSNLLYLLGEAGESNNQSIYELFDVPTSACISHDLVSCSYGSMSTSKSESNLDTGSVSNLKSTSICFPRYAHCSSWSPGMNDPTCPAEPDCEDGGLAYISFAHDIGYPAYDVGCRLSINQSICFIPSPPPPPPKPGVTHKYVLIFVITISVGVTILSCLIVYCYVQHRRAVTEQRWSAIRDWTSRESFNQFGQSINQSINQLFRHRPSISEAPVEERYRPLMND